jgi:hypothetical protein
MSSAELTKAVPIAVTSGFFDDFIGQLLGYIIFHTGHTYVQGYLIVEN